MQTSVGVRRPFFLGRCGGVPVGGAVPYDGPEDLGRLRGNRRSPPPPLPNRFFGHFGGKQFLISCVFSNIPGVVLKMTVKSRSQHSFEETRALYRRLRNDDGLSKPVAGEHSEPQIAREGCALDNELGMRASPLLTAAPHPVGPKGGGRGLQAIPPPTNPPRSSPYQLMKV